MPSPSFLCLMMTAAVTTHTVTWTKYLHQNCHIFLLPSVVPYADINPINIYPDRLPVLYLQHYQVFDCYPVHYIKYIYLNDIWETKKAPNFPMVYDILALALPNDTHCGTKQWMGDIFTRFPECEKDDMIKLIFMRWQDSDCPLYVSSWWIWLVLFQVTVRR